MTFRSYHREDGGSGFAVADAKTLIDEFIKVRETMTDAIQSGTGEWRNDQ